MTLLQLLELGSSAELRVHVFQRLTPQRWQELQEGGPELGIALGGPNPGDFHRYWPIARLFEPFKANPKASRAIPGHRAALSQESASLG